VVELSSLVTVTLVGLPLDVLVVDDPSKIVFEFTPPALEYEEGRNTKEHTNNAKSGCTRDVGTSLWSFCNSFFCGVIIGHAILTYSLISSFIISLVLIVTFFLTYLLSEGASSTFANHPA
jgi:hypothetical protein